MDIPKSCFRWMLQMIPQRVDDVDVVSVVSFRKKLTNGMYPSSHNHGDPWKMGVSPIFYGFL